MIIYQKQTGENKQFILFVFGDILAQKKMAPELMVSWPVNTERGTGSATSFAVTFICDLANPSYLMHIRNLFFL